MVPNTLRRQVLGRSLTRSELPRCAATATASNAPTKKRAAAISDQARSRAPIRVHTFMPAKNTCATAIQGRPVTEGGEGRERREGSERKRRKGRKEDAIRCKLPVCGLQPVYPAAFEEISSTKAIS